MTRSPSETADSPLHDLVENAALLPLERRTFLKACGVFIATAHAVACSRSPERIVPYVEMPEELIPGNPIYYASAITRSGVARGVLVETQMGRPVKLEGNPAHPESLGALDAYTQASIRMLYDPLRSQFAVDGGRPADSRRINERLAAARTELQQGRGKGVVLLTSTITSPTTAGLIAAFLKQYPEASWYQYDPLSPEEQRSATRMIFGKELQPVYRFDQADCVLSCSCDFLLTERGSLRYARDFSQNHHPASRMLKLYLAESSYSVTGAKADERAALRPSEEMALIGEVARLVGALPDWKPGALRPELNEFAQHAAKSLKKGGPKALVVAGERANPEVQGIAFLINSTLGSIGRTISFISPVEGVALGTPNNSRAGLAELVGRMNGGEINRLIIAGANPVFAAPADLEFAGAMDRVKDTWHLGLIRDETGGRAKLHIPQAHELESWGDARAFDGTVTLIQPTISPLFGGRVLNELLSQLIDQSESSAEELLRRHWSAAHPGDPASFQRFFDQSLKAGVVEGTALEPAAPRPISDAAARFRPVSSAAVSAAGAVELVYCPDPAVWDGSGFHNAWLQELPHPFTKLTWDNALLLSPADMKANNLVNGQMVEIKVGERKLRPAVFGLAGLPEQCVTLSVGYGRLYQGDTLGFNAGVLQTRAAFWSASDVQIAPLGRDYRLASTLGLVSMDRPAPTRMFGLSQLPALKPASEEQPSLYPPKDRSGEQWGMAIDLTSCIGCNACVTACQAENNILVAGKDQVARGRSMLWLRVDRDTDEHGRVNFQPVPCMHCENAPCELVCPVAATAHSHDGLNQMTYNRCVGTRFCSHNCPYKVRRFNFLSHADDTGPMLALLRNPDVTVRERGVMEKCTYCVQRIQEAKIHAGRENRPIADGEIVPACAQTCPAHAIVFGDVSKADSAVSQKKASPLNYGLLAELNTKPRTTYLARVINDEEV